MIKINQKLANGIVENTSLSTNSGFGIITEFGAVIGDAEFILFYPENTNEVFLVHRSEIEIEGILVRIKSIGEK